MNESYLKVSTSHICDDWSTPVDIYDLFVNKFGFYDPCPLDSNGCDALLLNWKDFNFVNPPYSDLKRFIEKSLLVAESGSVVMLLIPFRPDTYWFKSLFNSNICKFVFLTGRLCFGKSKHTAPFPSIFVLLDRNFVCNSFELINKKDVVPYFNKSLRSIYENR